MLSSTAVERLFSPNSTQMPPANVRTDKLMLLRPLFKVDITSEIERVVFGCLTN